MYIDITLLYYLFLSLDLCHERLNLMSVLYLVLKFNSWTRNLWWLFQISTARKMKFSIKDFFSKCDQICNFLGIWSHLLKKSFMGSLIYLCCVWFTHVHVFFLFSFCLGFLSWTFTIHRIAGEGGGYLFNSSIRLSPASRTLRH